ncbi:velvet factor, partial [Phaeosphaeriaceae sp. PMI808]
VPPVAPLRPQGCNLLIRQQPKEALVTADGKERTRKPIDPPPIIELNVPPTYDPHQQYLQSPYLFTCVSLWKADKDEPYDGSGEKSLTGSLVSSLHRLKDVSNKDGGFFIFGDISVRVQGTFRLRFSLYEFQNGGVEVQCLGTCNSDKFKVLPAKDFKGMEESTYLSRAFSDQGVRLRLRKEPRGMMGGKRTYPYSSESSDAPLRP